MRILGAEEQDLCLRIIKGRGKNNYLGNIIDHKLGGVCISTIKQPQKVELEFTIQKPQSPTEEKTKIIIERIEEISLLILTTVNLIKMLERDGYVMLLQRATQLPNPSKFGRCIGNMPCITYQFSDKNISDLLIEYISKEIYVTDEFLEFCEHNFISREERRFRRGNLNAGIAISIALFAALTNLFFNVWNKISDGTKIKQEQINSITGGLKAIENKPDTLIIKKQHVITPETTEQLPPINKAVTKHTIKK